MRYFRFLAAGNATSAYGVYLNLVAFNLFVYEATDSAFQTGLIMAVRLLVGMVGGLLAGRLAARLDLKRIMITAEASQAAGLVCLVSFHQFAGDWLLYAVVVVAGLCSSSSVVALRTAVPAMVGSEHRVWANGLLASCRSLAMVAGFASAGVVVSLLGYTAAFLIAAGTFTLSAANLAWLPLRTRSEPAENPTARKTRETRETQETGREAPASDGTDARGAPTPGRAKRLAAAAFGHLSPLVLTLIAIRAVDGFGSSAHNVGMPIQSRALDPSDPAVFMSQFWTAWAIGNIIAQRLTTRYARRHGAPSERAFAVGVMVMSAAFILAFAGLPAVLAVPVILLAGMADGFTENTFISRLQTLPEKRRAEAFGLSTTAENTTFGLGMVVSASLLEQFSPFGVVAGMHGAALVLGVGFLLAHRRLRAASGGDVQRDDAARSDAPRDAQRDEQPRPGGQAPGASPSERTQEAQR